MNANSTTLIVGAAMLLPLALAALVGVPAWIVGRMADDHRALAATYRSAVGIPEPELKWNPGRHAVPWPLLFWGAWKTITDFLPNPAAYTVHVIVFSGLGLYFGQKVWRNFLILKEHPDLDPKLRRIPKIECLAWSAVALAFFAVVYVIVAIAIPEEISLSRIWP